MKENIKSFIKVTNQLIYILTSEQKKKSVYTLGIIIIGSFFELLGVTAIFPLIQAMITPQDLQKNKVVAFLLQLFHVKSEIGLLVLMGIGVILIYILKNVFLVYSNYQQAHYSTLIQKELSVRMLKSYINKPYSFYLNNNSADVMRGIGNDSNGVYAIIAAVFSLIAEMLAVFLITVYIMKTDFFIASGVIILAIVTLFLIIVFFKPLLKKAGEESRNAASKKHKSAYHIVNGIKEILITQRKEEFAQGYENATELARVSQRTYDFINASPERIIEGFCVSGLIGIIIVRICLGIDVVSFVPKLGSFAMAAFKILPSIGKITSRINVIVFQRPALENVYDTMKQDAEYKEQEIDNNRKNIEGGNAEKILKNEVFNNSLEVKNVSWTYPFAHTETLSNISLTLYKGESIAFIGSSGAGKSTLADIILGLYKPQSGEILSDGIDIYSIPRQWSKVIGYVPQTVFMLDDTIRNNILFGLPLESDEQIWNALEKAQLKEYIKKLPNKLDTYVGERGIKFSGGQRQRLAIARAIYQQPEILVMDEATSALDAETENALMEAIEMLKGQVTMIIIAHRLSTIKSCDKIYEIVNHKIVERKKVDLNL